MFRGEITEFQLYQNRKAEKLIMMPFCQEDLAMHGHNFFELAYITGGTAEHTLETEVKTISAGDYFIVDYGCLHGFQNCKNLTLINCLFLPETVDETLQGCRSFSQLLQGCLLKYYRMSLGKAKLARVFHDRNGQVGRLMQEMLREYQEQKVGCYPLLRFKLLEILLLTLRGLIEPEIDRPYSTSVQEVLEYVNGNYQDSLTLGTFCEQKHYSVAYISRRFKQETGVTLREYVQKIRIEKSCELLEDSDLRVVEIARRVGYEDIKFFNQIFKRRMQVSPREYRKICMNRAADG